MLNVRFSGNAIIIGSTTAFVIGLTWGGITHPWKSAQVLVPLILGACGFGVFVAYEGMFAKNPIVSPVKSLPLSYLLTAPSGTMDFIEQSDEHQRVRFNYLIFTDCLAHSVFQLFADVHQLSR